MSNDQYEKLERERREGQHRGIDELAWRRKETERDGRMDLRDEEAQTELRRITVEWEDVRAGIQRGVVLGDPGFGKTTLLWHEVGRRNEEWLAKIADNQASLEQAEVSVFVRALELAQWIEKEPLLEALLSHLRGRWHVSDATVKLVGTKLANGAGLIAIDALDEVPMDLRDRLDTALADFAATHNGARVLLSSRLVGYTRAPMKVEEQDEFEVLAFEPGQMEQAVQAWFAPDGNAGAEAWRHIESQSGVSGDLRCPLLLRLACALIGKARNKGAAFPSWEYRAELYDGFLVHGVNLWSDRAKPGAQARGLFLDFSGALALELCKTSARRTLWDQTEIARKVEALQKNYYALQKRDNLIGDLCDAGILSLAGPDDLTTPLMFTHRSFGEYLAARGLAQRLNDGEAAGWDLVEEKSWWADWEQVFLFLAGALSQHPAELGRLIEVFSDEQADDLVHFRLLLAAKCLAELPAKAVTGLRPVARAIIERAYAWWQQFRTSGAGSALPSVARIDSNAGCVLLTQLLDSFLEPERHDHEYFESTAVLAAMGPAAAVEGVLNRLIEKLSHSDMRAVSAMSALAVIGPGAARNDIFRALLDFLHHSDADFRSRAAATLGEIGAISQDILKGIRGLLDDPVWHVKVAAAGALSSAKLPAAREAAFRWLLDLVHDPHNEMSSAFVNLRSMGSVACQKDIVDRLLGLLRDPTALVRLYALWALTPIRSGAAQWPEIVSRVFENFGVSELRIGYLAAEQLGEIAASARSHDGILDELVERMRHPDRRMQSVARYAVRSMGTRTARGDILDCLMKSLHDRDGNVRVGAIEALAGVGVAAARKNILERLLEMRRDPSPHVRRRAAEGLVHLISDDTRDEILGTLLHLLNDREEVVRVSASEALATIGPAAARSHVLDALEHLLSAPALALQSGVVRAIRQMGAAAARDEVVSRLVGMLEHEGSYVALFNAADDIHNRMALTEEAFDNFRPRLLRLMRDIEEQHLRAWHAEAQVVVMTGQKLMETGEAADPTEVHNWVGQLLNYIRSDYDLAKGAAEALERFASEGVHVFLRDGKLIIKRIATSPQVE